MRMKGLMRGWKVRPTMAPGHGDFYRVHLRAISFDEVEITTAYRQQRFKLSGSRRNGRHWIDVRKMEWSGGKTAVCVFVSIPYESPVLDINNKATATIEIGKQESTKIEIASGAEVTFGGYTGDLVG